MATRYKIPPIDAFPHGIWEVKWFGTLIKSGEFGDEYFVETLITETIRWYGEKRISKTIKIHICELPFVTIGSVWENGVLKSRDGE